jgi:uncharacterized protein involved in exopolysaccharide biosynthesis
MISIKSTRDILRIIYIFKWRALLSFLFVIAAIVSLLFVLRPQYRSEARILINLGRTNAALPVEVQDRPTAVAQNYRRDYLIDESQLLVSDLIVNQLVGRWASKLTERRPPTTWFGHLKAFLRDNLTALSDWTSDELVWLGLLDPSDVHLRIADLLTRRFVVDHEAGAAVLNLSLTLESPTLARDILDDWIRIYLAERLRTPSGTQLRDFYQGEVRSVSGEVAHLEAERGAIERRLGTFDLAKRELALSARIDTMAAERSRTAAEINGIEISLASSAEALAKIPGYVAAEFLTAENPTVRDLISRLNNLLLERQSQLRLYAADSPPILQLDASIQEVRGWIQRETKTAGIGETKKINPLAARINDDIVMNRIHLAELRAKEASLASEIAELEQERHAVLEAKSQVEDLDRRLTVANQTFQLYSTNLEKARVDLELDQRLISNVQIIQPASFSAMRTFPRTVPLLAASPGIGLAFALFVIYISALLDRRIHDGDKLQHYFDLPLLATIPEMSAPRSPSGREAARLARASTAQLVARFDELLGEHRMMIAFTSAQHGDGVSFVVRRLRDFVRHPPASSESDGEQTRLTEASFAEAPAIGSEEESLPILHRADCIVLVLHAGRTTVPVAEAAVEALRSSFGGKLIGFVLNRRQRHIPDWLYRVVG